MNTLKLDGCTIYHNLGEDLQDLIDSVLVALKLGGKVKAVLNSTESFKYLSYVANDELEFEIIFYKIDNKLKSFYLSDNNIILAEAGTKLKPLDRDNFNQLMKKFRTKL